MLETYLIGVKTGLHVVDRPAVLNRHDPTSREAPAIANAVDFVKNWRRWVARAQEIRVQRVRPPVRHRAPRCHQGLGGDLTPEGALARFFRVRPSKDVVVN